MSVSKFFRSMEEMPVIGTEEFNVRTEEILSDINDNNIAYILSCAKNKYVICNYKWYEICFDENFSYIINYAIELCS